MIKKLLPTMVGVILAGGMTAAASADVTVFGHLDTAIANVDPITASGDSDTNFYCTTCSVGFKGSEDLGNGLKAIFKLDYQFDMFNRNGDSDNPTAITDRDQYLGLAGNFGQVVFGTMSTTYKGHGALLDPGYRTIAQMRDVGIQSELHNGAGEDGSGRTDNSLRYDSPEWAGFQVMFTYTLDSNEDEFDDGTPTPAGVQEDDNPYSLGAQYSNGGVLVFADYVSDDNGGNDDAWKVGGKFGMDNFSVFGQYENDGGLISQSNGYFTGVDADGYEVNADGADLWMLGGSFTMGNNTVYGAYGSGDDANDTAFDEGYDSWEIVGVHGFSKRTLAYAGYVNIDPDADGEDDVDVWTVGMKHKF